MEGVEGVEGECLLSLVSDCAPHASPSHCRPRSGNGFPRGVKQRSCLAICFFVVASTSTRFTLPALRSKHQQSTGGTSRQPRPVILRRMTLLPLHPRHRSRDAREHHARAAVVRVGERAESALSRPSKVKVSTLARTSIAGKASFSSSLGRASPPI